MVQRVDAGEAPLALANGMKWIVLSWSGHWKACCVRIGGQSSILNQVRNLAVFWQSAQVKKELPRCLGAVLAMFGNETKSLQQSDDHYTATTQSRLPPSFTYTS